MTTSTLTMNALGTARVGKECISVQTFSVDIEEFAFTVYKDRSGTFYEACGTCSEATGFRPEYAHVFGGICFDCGGVGVRRIGSESAMKRRLRRRVNSRKNRLNAVERREEMDRLAAEKWALEHPNVAGLLAQSRSGSDRGPHNDLMSLALSAQRKPLSVAQERYAERLLLQRALDVAYPPLAKVYVGEVGEVATLAGRVRNVQVLPPYVLGGRSTTLVLMSVPIDGNVAVVKMTTSAAWADNVTAGEEITVRGRVEAHNDHERYGLQTVLKAPKRVDK